jgi:hypothetical protein
MNSLYEELSEKVKKDPRLTKRGGARSDIGLLLFSAREDLSILWKAADRCARFRDADTLGALHDAVEKLRPLFGERGEV